MGEERRGDDLYLSAMRRIFMRLEEDEARTRCYRMPGLYYRSLSCAVELEEALWIESAMVSILHFTLSVFFPSG